VLIEWQVWVCMDFDESVPVEDARDEASCLAIGSAVWRPLSCAAIFSGGLRADETCEAILNNLPPDLVFNISETCCGETPHIESTVTLHLRIRLGLSSRVFDVQSSAFANFLAEHIGVPSSTVRIDSRRSLRALGRRRLVATGVEVDARALVPQSRIGSALADTANGSLAAAAAGGWFSGLKVVHVEVIEETGEYAPSVLRTTTRGNAVTVWENAGATLISGFVVDILKGVLDSSGVDVEAHQSLEFRCAVAESWMFGSKRAAYGQPLTKTALWESGGGILVTPTGELAFTLGADVHGSATVEIVAVDSGGVELQETPLTHKPNFGLAYLVFGCRSHCLGDFVLLTGV
jgi:hypothetical protein